MSETVVSPVLLHDLAHARAGDKGERVNVSLIAYDPGAYAFLAERVTAARVAEWFGQRRIGRVVRYDLPNLHAFNFVLDGALEGGVNDSLNLDGHGKTLAFHLLAMPVPAPESLVLSARRARQGI